MSGWQTTQPFAVFEIFKAEVHLAAPERTDCFSGLGMSMPAIVTSPIHNIRDSITQATGILRVSVHQRQQCGVG